MTVRVLFQKSSADTAESVRLGFGAAMDLGATALERRAGLVPSPGAAAISNVSGMVGRVAPFVAWVDGTSNAAQGGYPFVADANTDLTFDAGEAANSRVDRTVAQVRDDPYDSSGQQDGRIVIVKGQAGGGANPVPASSILLYETTVPAGASAGGGGFDIAAASAAKFPFTTGLGGMLLVRDATDEATVTAYEGRRIYRLDASEPRLYSGGAWRWDGPPLYARRTSPSTASNNSTSPLSDAVLAVTVKPNAVYEVTGHIVYLTTDPADIQIGWAGPASATFEWVPLGIPVGVTSGDGTLRVEASAISDMRTLGGGGGGSRVARPAGTLVTSSAGGTFQLRYAQGTATVTDTTIRGGSYIRLDRVG